MRHSGELSLTDLIMTFLNTPYRLPVGFGCHFVPRDDRMLELLKGVSLED
jgi:hypothetical protein